IGEENRRRKRFEDMDKEYEFEIVFGYETDSYDLMGMITSSNLLDQPGKLRALLPAAMKPLIGTWHQPYPPYSSATVLGKPLYWWTRQGRLGEVSIPTKEITVSELEVIGWRDSDIGDVAREAIKRIENVHGDFRQDEIIAQWQTVAKLQTNVKVSLATCRVVCSSGTYVRGLAHTLGRALKTHALAYSIKRTRIGEYRLG
ncbi:hypothetical protein HYS00_02285, partial [Candidatus Microgenomates bacterium]|nr:hypothetical protein [Candidatus Microgenomates bacterium]